jgi:hypothetical protein
MRDCLYVCYFRGRHIVRFDNPDLHISNNQVGIWTAEFYYRSRTLHSVGARLSLFYFPQSYYCNIIPSSIHLFGRSIFHTTRYRYKRMTFVTGDLKQVERFPFLGLSELYIKAQMSCFFFLLVVGYV